MRFCLKYKYIFLLRFELRSDPEPDPDFFQLSRIRIIGKEFGYSFLDFYGDQSGF